jgi:predicted nucleic acid-binding protein
MPDTDCCNKLPANARTVRRSPVKDHNNPYEAAVADATVLIFLGKLDKLDRLRERYGTVSIPEAVHEEVVVAGKEIGARDAALAEAAIEDGWLVVESVEANPAVERFDLEAGETAALSLALELDADCLLADEEAVREVARLLDLEPRGTLSILFDELRSGEATFDDFVDSLERLVDEGFYLDEAVYLQAIRKARELAD